MDVIHCFKGRDASLPVCLACCMHELSPGLPWIRAAVLEFQNWGKPLVIAVISLPNYSARLLTCPYPLRLCSCCHFTPHSGWRVLDQQSNLCLLTAKQNSGVRAQEHFTSYSSCAKPQPGICEIKAQQFYHAMIWDSVLLAGVSVGLSAWEVTHYLIFGGVWLLSQSKMAKAKLSGEETSVGIFIWLLGGNCVPLAHCLRGVFLQMYIQGNVSLCFTRLCCAEITCYYWVWLV